jgi:undecaprenyl-diphosphatase
VRRQGAGRFSFLLSVPAICAAAAKEGFALAGTRLDADGPRLFAIGMASSAIVGYLTVKYFLRFLGGHTLDAFVWYRLALAAAVVIWWIG